MHRAGEPRDSMHDFDADATRRLIEAIDKET